MKRNSFLIIFAISFIIYLLPEYFFENAMMYVTGGIVGGSIKEVFKSIGEKPSDYIVYIVWTILLMVVGFLFFRLQYKPLKYFILIVIAILLYVFDFILISITNIEATDIKLIYSVTGLRILGKSLLLSLLFYFGIRQENADIKKVPN